MFLKGSLHLVYEGGKEVSRHILRDFAHEMFRQASSGKGMTVEKSETTLDLDGT